MSTETSSDSQNPVNNVHNIEKVIYCQDKSESDLGPDLTRHGPAHTNVAAPAPARSLKRKEPNAVSDLSAPVQQCSEEEISEEERKEPDHSPDSESEQDEEPAEKPIPLPNLDEIPTTCSPLLALLTKLEQEGLVSSEAARLLREEPADPNTLLKVLQDWSGREDAGARPRNSNEFQCLQPDSVAYPNAKQTSFKLYNLVLMLGQELPQMREFLVRSFKEGFDLQIDTSKIISRPKVKNPKQSPSEEMALALSIDTDFSLGYLYKATGEESNLTLNSVFCVPKRQFGQNIPDKFRRVMHPKGANEATDPEASAITYTSVMQAAQAAVKLRDQTGCSVRFSKYDCKHAFYLCPLQPSQIPYMGFEFGKQKYVFGRVPFGVRCGSRLFSSVALTINWLLKHVFLCPITFSYCDDFLLVCSSEAECRTLSAIFELIMKLLGVPLQADKIEIAQPEITFLGTEMDAEKETLDLPERRKQFPIAPVNSCRVASVQQSPAEGASVTHRHTELCL